MDRKEEAALVARAKRDPEAFGQLYELYVERIYAYLYYRTGNRQDAEDLTAQTFFKALEHIGRYREQGYPFGAWLFRIAHNLLINWRRDRKRHQEIALDDLSYFSALAERLPEETVEERERRRLLLRLVRRLPVERQQLLLLKFVARLSNAEIGELMGRSEGAIKSLYHRTLLALREELERELARSRRRARSSRGMSDEKQSL